ncbi:cytochrome c-type biogenesis protein CcmH [Alteromonas aestuariivivens]|uniref:Cytochrome c-type biogenesis protein n=1 Tax=Alteromonas aestuariivivens TaxID=1938339 RepID=A0A3D8M416_9ALTE|nr:cytochrome c-type biogenesis protein [Alteromonas aestuariivivens]RDV24429.1 cytochrome c-type biogenesis protein CcmH [Alteromonas aestuariivivens]
MLLSSWAVPAVEDNFAFDDPAKRAAYLRLTEELRCPMCQNQNIADSDAMIAHDMRRKVYTLLQQGKSEQQVIDYMKARYGDFVHYRPPVTLATFWLWALPILFAAAALIYVVVRRKPAMPEDMAAKLARAEKLLEQDK